MDGAGNSVGLSPTISNTLPPRGRPILSLRLEGGLASDWKLHIVITPAEGAAYFPFGRAPCPLRGRGRALGHDPAADDARYPSRACDPTRNPLRQRPADRRREDPLLARAPGQGGRPRPASPLGRLRDRRAGVPGTRARDPPAQRVRRRARVL